MYGLLLENLLSYLRTHYHPKSYDEILEAAKIPFKEADINKVKKHVVLTRGYLKTTWIIKNQNYVLSTRG